MRGRLETIVKFCVIAGLISGVISAWASGSAGEGPQAASVPEDIAPAKPPTNAVSDSAGPPQLSRSDTAGTFTADQLAEARAYLSATSRRSATMILQGPLAIERLHPEFVIRLANAIAEARRSGLPEVGIFSAYRPPAFGVGGFLDKFESLHAYGLAVDMFGIGPPGSLEAEQWHGIAAKHGVACPYGSRHRVEWNHCQPTLIKAVRSENPLRGTISAEGPVSLEAMFEVGNTLIAGVPETAASLAALANGPVQDPTMKPAPFFRANLGPAKTNGKTTAKGTGKTNGKASGDKVASLPAKPERPADTNLAAKKKRLVPNKFDKTLVASRLVRKRSQRNPRDEELRAAIEQQREVGDRVSRIYTPEPGRARN